MNEISLGVFIGSWITNHSDDHFILNHCCPLGCLFYCASRVKKRGGGICFFYKYDLHLENFENFTCEFFECCYASLTVGGSSYLVIAVYRPSGLNAKSFLDHFAILFEEKRLQFDKIVLLGDFNISLNVNNNLSKIRNSFFEDFGLTHYVSEKTHRRVGILDHLIASNNFSINVKLNSFITFSDHSFICFSISSAKQRKSQQRLMYRKWKRFDPKSFIKLLKSCLEIDVASSIDQAWGYVSKV